MPLSSVKVSARDLKDASGRSIFIPISVGVASRANPVHRRGMCRPAPRTYSTLSTQCPHAMDIRFSLQSYPKSYCKPEMNLFRKTSAMALLGLPSLDGEIWEVCGYLAGRSCLGTSASLMCIRRASMRPILGP